MGAPRARWAKTERSIATRDEDAATHNSALDVPGPVTRQSRPEQPEQSRTVATWRGVPSSLRAWRRRSRSAPTSTAMLGDPAPPARRPLRQQPVAPVLDPVQLRGLLRVGGAVPRPGAIQDRRARRIGGEQLAEVADVPALAEHAGIRRPSRIAWASGSSRASRSTRPGGASSARRARSWRAACSRLSADLLGGLRPSRPPPAGAAGGDSRLGLPVRDAQLQPRVAAILVDVEVVGGAQAARACRAGLLRPG